ncbi:hypothetical protein ACSBR2_033920 [Camellia fascicularis]
MASSSVSLDEQNGFVLEDKDLGLDAVFPSSLIGKVLAPKTLNKNVVSSIIAGAWKVHGTLNISHWSNNVFLFQFLEEDDQNQILCDGPWSLIGSLLVLCPPYPRANGCRSGFSMAPLLDASSWLPFNNMTKRTSEILGRRISQRLHVKAYQEGLLLNRSFLRIRVEVNTQNPLPRGLWLQRTSKGKEIWISFKYEKLSDFCYDCGRLGHDNKVCKFVTREQGQVSGYGPELRTRAVQSLGPNFDNQRSPRMKGLIENKPPLNHSGNSPFLAPNIMAAREHGTRHQPQDNVQNQCSPAIGGELCARFIVASETGGSTTFQTILSQPQMGNIEVGLLSPLTVQQSPPNLIVTLLFPLM